MSRINNTIISRSKSCYFSFSVKPFNTAFIFIISKIALIDIATCTTTIRNVFITYNTSTFHSSKHLLVRNLVYFTVILTPFDTKMCTPSTISIVTLPLFQSLELRSTFTSFNFVALLLYPTLAQLNN